MTGFLLDTSVFLWSLAAPDKLNSEALQVLREQHQRLFLSAASSWEISIKASLGKLKLPEPASQFVPKRLASLGIQSLPIIDAHALYAGELPRHHADPFDRMLVAQAQLENLTLLTADPLLKGYSVRQMWCGR
ncbi:MAG TPA: type II toxin-antitoxin system VapC family toxin [Terriglobales bacterium]|nr:type II toxin-antitoxin system VapC family toxin [Terriglobales bacterium]